MNKKLLILAVATIIAYVTFTLIKIAERANFFGVMEFAFFNKQIFLPIVIQVTLFAPLMVYLCLSNIKRSQEEASDVSDGNSKPKTNYLISPSLQIFCLSVLTAFVAFNSYKLYILDPSRSIYNNIYSELLITPVNFYNWELFLPSIAVVTLLIGVFSFSVLYSFYASLRRSS